MLGDTNGKSVNSAHKEAAQWRMNDWIGTFDGDDPRSEASHRDLHGRAAAGVWSKVRLLVPACGNGLRHSHFAGQEDLLRVCTLLQSCFVPIAAQHADRSTTRSH